MGGCALVCPRGTAGLMIMKLKHEDDVTPPLSEKQKTNGKQALRLCLASIADWPKGYVIIKKTDHIDARAFRVTRTATSGDESATAGYKIAETDWFTSCKKARALTPPIRCATHTDVYDYIVQQPGEVAKVHWAFGDDVQVATYWRAYRPPWDAVQTVLPPAHIALPT